MSAAHRWGRITKYLGIACLSIAILSTLVLNIISSYSNSSTRSNAEPLAEVSTLANEACDPSNTNAAACISLSITSSSSSSTGGNDTNLSLSIPQGGGIATGRHTVEVSSNSYAGWSVSLTSKNGETDLVNNSDSKYTIPTLPSTATVDKATTLANNTYGVAFPYDDWLTKNYYNEEADYLSTDQAVLATTRWTSLASLTKAIGIAGSDVPTSATRPGTRNIYYGVMIDDPVSFPAGDYSASVVYTATALLPPTPSNLSVNPATFEFDSCNDSLITIEGTNLSSAYEVYLQKSGTTDEVNRLECTNLDVESNAKLTCNIPTSRDEVELNTTYDIYVISQAANPGVLKNAFTYTEPATGLSVKSDNENIIVDYDENLIPVVYVGYNGNGGGYWQVVTDQEIEENTNNWFRYGETPEDKRWANAITVTAEARESYRKKQTGEDPDPRILPSDNPSGNGEANPEILGYWVYIPRYAYEVMRPNAVDRVVDDDMAEEEGGFNINFETVNDTKKIPAESCNLGISTADQMWDNRTPTSNAGPTNTNIRAKDYRTGCWPNNRTYHRQTIAEAGSATDNTTTWATHPAFTWGDTELNGLWVGKFETTGKVNAPTVKPNQHANVDEYIGEFYTMAKSIGKEDKCNVGGNTISGIEQNSHNLQTTKSHMLKNSEWGAVAYLSASKYGAGVNGTQPNAAYPANGKDADGDADVMGRARYGITGCGPASDGSTSYYPYSNNVPAGTRLDAKTIESPTACSTDTRYGYNGEIGVLASITNTVYGIYDMSGGAYEYVMGNLTGYDDQSETITGIYMRTKAKPPYVDLYKESPYGNFTSGVSSGAANNPVDWSAATIESLWNNDVCTWGTCGGHALHETKQYQSVSDDGQSWGGDSFLFVYSSNRWFQRGGNASIGSLAGLFYSDRYNGDSSPYNGFRAALLVMPDGQ